MSASPAIDSRANPDFGAVLTAPASVLTHPLEPAGTRAHDFDRDAIKTIMAGIYDRGDRLMLRFLAAHMAVALLLALYFDTWTATLITGGIALGTFAATARLFPRTFFTRCVAGLALQTFVALHIYQLHGLAEMHFFFFTGFTMMLVYQDGLSMWPGCIAIILQHIAFAYNHNQGAPLHFFEVPHITVTRLFYHFGIAIVQVAICGAWAHLLRRQTLRDAWQKTRLREAGTFAAEQLETIRASEAALRDAWERQRAILDYNPDLAWVQDLDGRYVAVNRAFTAAAGQPAERIIGRTAGEIFGEEAAARYRAEDSRVLADQVKRQVEEVMVDTTGLRRDIETIRGPVFDGEHRIVGIIGIGRDITDRKRADQIRRDLEAKMQEAQKLESLGVLAGGIAHDFNNLLVGVLGNASLAREDVADGSPTAALLDEIETAARRAADLTRQMLAYAGRGRVTMVPIDLSALVRDMSQLLRSAVSKNAELEFHLEPGLPHVQGDAAQIRQVVMNLVTNASDALLDQTGIIRIETRAVPGSAWTGSSLAGQHLRPDVTYVAIEVSDSGAGMDEATIARIFDPFFTTKFTGRGLGLSAVQGIARAHGAVIGVRSQPNGGTRFEILWPVSLTAPAVPVPPPAVPEPVAVTRRLLVIDDEAPVRRTAIRILQRAGYHVEGAADGEMGLQRIREAAAPFDVVLVDLTMPGMNGIETLAAIREVDPMARSILVSGYHETDLPIELGDGAQRFLQKPYASSELTEIVAEVLAAPTRACSPSL